MNTDLLKNPSSIADYFNRKKYLKEFAASHPNYFEPVGTLIFCGKQFFTQTNGCQYFYSYI